MYTAHEQANTHKYTNACFLCELCQRPLLMQGREAHWDIVILDNGIQRNSTWLILQVQFLLPVVQTSWITNIDFLSHVHSYGCLCAWSHLPSLSWEKLVRACLLRQKLPCWPIDLMSLCYVLLCVLCKLCCRAGTVFANSDSYWERQKEEHERPGPCSLSYYNLQRLHKQPSWTRQTMDTWHTDGCRG